MPRIKLSKRKESCPECCAYTVVISPENCLFLKELKGEILIKKHRTDGIEKLINKIISEYRFAKENKAVII